MFLTTSKTGVKNFEKSYDVRFNLQILATYNECFNTSIKNFCQQVRAAESTLIYGRADGVVRFDLHISGVHLEILAYYSLHYDTMQNFFKKVLITQRPNSWTLKLPFSRHSYNTVAQLTYWRWLSRS